MPARWWQEMHGNYMEWQRFIVQIFTDIDHMHIECRPRSRSGGHSPRNKSLSFKSWVLSVFKTSGLFHRVLSSTSEQKVIQKTPDISLYKWQKRIPKTSSTFRSADKRAVLRQLQIHRPSRECRSTDIKIYFSLVKLWNVLRSLFHRILPSS